MGEVRAFGWVRVVALAAVFAGQCTKASDPDTAPTAAQPTGGMPVTGAPGGGGTAPTAGASGSAGTAPSTTPNAGASGSAAGAGASGSAAGAGGAAPDAGSPAVDPDPAVDAGATAPTSHFPPVTDLTGNGPYTPKTMDDSGPSNGYTVYYPEQLAPDGNKNPYLTWGNGATTTPQLYALLPHLASHGFVVIASNNAFVTSAEMRAGLDWLELENARMGSVFFGKLDTSKVASMGYSLGSLGTFELAADPRLVTTVHISGGAMDKSVVPNLKHMAAFFCGNSDDIAHDNCESDFTMAAVPVFYGVFPGDHFGILGAFADQIGEAATGWLRWKLMNDDTHAVMFQGKDCTLCKDSRWVVKQKDL